MRSLSRAAWCGTLNASGAVLQAESAAFGINYRNRTLFTVSAVNDTCTCAVLEASDVVLNAKSLRGTLAEVSMNVTGLADSTSSQLAVLQGVVRNLTAENAAKDQMVADLQRALSLLTTRFNALPIQRPCVFSNSPPVGTLAIVVAGGVLDAPGTSGWTGTTRVYAYDPNCSRTWQLASLPSQCYNSGGSGGFAIGRWFYALCGAASWRYDVLAASWSSIAQVPLPGSAFAAAHSGGVFFAMGGVNGTVTLSDVVRYDTATDGPWSPVANMRQPRQHAAAAMLAGEIYVAGGMDSPSSNANYMNTFEKYTPGSGGQWTMLPPMAVSRAYFGMASLGGSIYVASGQTSRVAPYYTASVERYTPTSGSSGIWTTVASLNAARAQVQLINRNGTLWAIGGRFNLGLVEYYDASRDRWVIVTYPPDGTLPVPESGGFAAGVVQF